MGAEDKNTYVVVAFLRNGHSYARTALLPPDAKLQIDDKVYVNFKDCNAPLPKRNS